MKRNIAGLILSGLMVVLLIACGENGANPEVPEESGANPEGPPETTTLDGVTYTVIAEESDFDKMRSDLTGNYYLWRDIALTGDFDPIGNNSKPFTGIFEGNNKTISNLRIAKSSENYVGFFGQIGSAKPVDSDTNGEVRNLTLVLTAGNVDDPSVKGLDSVGALAGWSYGKIEAVGVEGGFVKGNSDVGGLVGWVYSGGTITWSYATGEVKGGERVGGLVGYANGGSITSSYATGEVKGDAKIGGLVGHAFNTTITSSYATGEVTLTGTGSNIGGLVGYTSGSTTITSSYATGEVKGTGSNVGRLVGRADGTITSSYFDTNSTSQTSGIGQDNNSQSGNVTGYHTDDNNTPDVLGDDTVKNNGVAVTQSDFVDDPSTIDYVEWDFDAVWRWVADGQWPLLAWQLEQ